MRLSRTTVAFAILGIALFAAAAYFVYLFLAPPAGVPPLRRSISTELRTDVLTDKQYRALAEYATLPIVAPEVGWPNPFQPLEDR